MKLIKRKDKGLTLIEALIWFALFAAVIYSAFVMYNHYKNEQKIYTVSKELETIYKKTEAMFALTTNDVLNTLPVTKQDFLDFGIYPTTLKVRTVANTTSAFGPININYNGADGMQVNYTKIPKGEICSKIILSQKLIGWYKVNSLNYNSSLTPSSISSLCSGNGNVNLTFWMKSYQPENMNP